MTKLGSAFTRSGAVLVAYVMAGYPDRAGSLAALEAVARGGAGVIELGVPYGDAVADGPVIVDAGKAALANGFGLAETIALAGEFLGAHADAPPVALMTYLNPMMRLGFPRVATLAAEAGVSGFIVPDLPPDSPMADRWLVESEPLGIDTVFLAAPTSPPARLDALSTRSRGFVYVVSSLGVTGERDELATGLAALVARVREHTTLPVAVGFGVGTPEQAAEVAKIANGVVVGSAIVRRQGDAAELEAFVRALVGAVEG
ncbi:MAG: tryptophan synthase subunit alpha [Actinobacteria bacterium HGW-Actinobacteria-6]|nr:MAG: tryptophan synthase subunit alpha [Actinobacteria bacterium HGW-Actinobacteria-6]